MLENEYIEAFFLWDIDKLSDIFLFRMIAKHSIAPLIESGADIRQVQIRREKFSCLIAVKKTLSSKKNKHAWYK